MSLEIFTLIYLVFSYFIIYPPTEFVIAGFTIPTLFSNFLGSEEQKLILHHIRKSLLLLFTYSIIPLGYFLSLVSLEYVEDFNSIFYSNVIWKTLFTTSIVLPLGALFLIYEWTRDEYKYHPIAINLAKFCNNNNSDWKSVAADIDIEYRRVDKICLQINPITKIIATENWILKISSLTIQISHQTDSSLIVKQSDTYHMSQENNLGVEYVNIEVRSTRRNVQSFILRINANDFKDLQDRIARNITIPPDVKFHQSVTEQFIDVFKDTVKNNVVYETNQELDQCVGCLQTRPNVKLQKLCESTGQNNCTTCYCKPMWCVDCMGKWFAVRQINENNEQNKWLSSKCTCPLCRATFCILDVCLLPVSDDNQ